MSHWSAPSYRPLNGLHSGLCFAIVQYRAAENDICNMSREAQQLSTPVTPQELNSTPDAFAQMTLMRSPTALSITLSGSRKRQRLDTFFKGKVRAAYGLLPVLEQSLSSSDGSFLHKRVLRKQWDIASMVSPRS